MNEKDLNLIMTKIYLKDDREQRLADILEKRIFETIKTFNHEYKTKMHVTVFKKYHNQENIQKVIT